MRNYMLKAEAKTASFAYVNLFWEVLGDLKRAGWFEGRRKLLRHALRGAAGELDVLWHDGDTLGMDGAQVGVPRRSPTK